MIALVPRIVEHHGDGMVRKSSRQCLEEFDHADTVNVGFVGDGDNLIGDGYGALLKR